MMLFVRQVLPEICHQARGYVSDLVFLTVSTFTQNTRYLVRKIPRSTMIIVDKVSTRFVKDLRVATRNGNNDYSTAKIYFCKELRTASLFLLSVLV